MVLYCWHVHVSHVVHRVENLRPQKKRTWTGLVMAPSTAELYPPRRDINGPKCAHSGLRKEMVSFAGKSGKTAKKSGFLTEHYLTRQFHGDHNPGRHSRPNMTGRKSAPALGGFKSYYSSGGDSENVESGKSLIDSFHIWYNTLTFSSSPRRWRLMCGLARSLQCRIQYYARISYG